MSDATWLPNLVGGTSIWKLAVDLNEPKFFDGRLLVPETEGSESLPVTVRWDLTGLVPLREAQATSPEDARAAIADFQRALERVAKVFATPNSGFDKYRDAFTVPSLEADDGASYFYSPSSKKLFVVNWGASPRTMGGKAEYVFGYADWAKQWKPAAAAAGAAAAVVAGALAADGAVPANEAAPPKAAEAETAKREEKRRPWWIWPLFGLVAIALVLLALFLLKACEEPRTVTAVDAANDALLDRDGRALADGDAANEGPGGGASSSADNSGGSAKTGGAGDGSGGGDGDGGASSDGAAKAPSDAGPDAGAAKDSGSGAPSDDDDDGPVGSSSGVHPPGGGGGGGGAGPSGSAVVTIGPGGGEKTGVHRKHYSDEATHWRVTSGGQKVSRTEDQGHRFDVWLAPGQSFEGVRVEWQDKAGKWHVH